jgi:phospholipase C
MAQTRRDFLKVAAMLSGAAGVSGVVPDSIQRAFAIEPESGSTYLDAEHIVLLMQENRSFDHALGTLQGVRGFNDPRAIQLANGNSVFVQTDAAGNSYAPWRLDIRDTRITWMGSIPHFRNSQGSHYRILRTAATRSTCMDRMASIVPSQVTRVCPPYRCMLPMSDEVRC